MLWLSIHRYNKLNAKLTTPVDYPVELNLRSYVAAYTKYSEGEGLYDLVACVSHQGGKPRAHIEFSLNPIQTGLFLPSLDWRRVG